MTDVAPSACRPRRLLNVPAGRAVAPFSGRGQGLRRERDDPLRTPAVGQDELLGLQIDHRPALLVLGDDAHLDDARRDARRRGPAGAAGPWPEAAAAARAEATRSTRHGPAQHRLEVYPVSFRSARPPAGRPRRSSAVVPATPEGGSRGIRSPGGRLVARPGGTHRGDTLVRPVPLRRQLLRGRQRPDLDPADLDLVPSAWRAIRPWSPCVHPVVREDVVDPDVDAAAAGLDDHRVPLPAAASRSHRSGSGCGARRPRRRPTARPPCADGASPCREPRCSPGCTRSRRRPRCSSAPRSTGGTSCRGRAAATRGR